MMNIDNGQRMYNLADKIFPYCRSITGEGVRATLADINEYLVSTGAPALNIYEVPSGTKVFDWTVPKEWKIREAYIEDEAGNHIIDMAENNLHVLGYSAPVDEWVDLDELKNHIYTQPDQPDWIPYVTSYYKERYGFCMTENMKNSLKEGKYHMYIDSELFDGVLNYADLIIPGESEQEIMFSTYFCHPSMANNECSGPVVQAELIRYVSAMEHRKYTYRFIYIPETIGSITYLSQGSHLADMKKNVIAGFNLSCVGDNREYSYIESKYADTLADRILKNVLKFHTGDNYKTYTFLTTGSDERRYNSAGVDLPVVGFCRSKYVVYPEYHTSADNMSLISTEGLQGAYDVMTKVIDALEYNKHYMMKCICEPQLGPRGLYPSFSQKGSATDTNVMMMLIFYSDGRSDLIDISNRLDVPISELIKIVEKLKACDLIE
ncbi:MAG: DUF4910 domain-containing protein [Lachnospiraceae bacterium]|nr:DUF4910 domain-containing protein [Lachnospiraceae bacterium]